MRAAIPACAAALSLWAAGCIIEPNPSPWEDGAPNLPTVHTDGTGDDAAEQSSTSDTGTSDTTDTGGDWTDDTSDTGWDTGDTGDETGEDTTDTGDTGTEDTGDDPVIAVIGGGPLAPGGAQDAAQFRDEVHAGGIPKPEVFEVAGWLNEHGTLLPPALDDRPWTLHGFASPGEGDEPTVMLQLGMNSGPAPALSLTVLVDTGSDEVKQGLLALLDQLDGDDRLSIVTYGGGAEVALPPTAISEVEQPAIEAAIAGLGGGGESDLAAGLKVGTTTCGQGLGKDRQGHVLVLSAAAPGSPSTDGWIDDIRITTVALTAETDLVLLSELAQNAGSTAYMMDDAAMLPQVVAEAVAPVVSDLEVSFTLPSGFTVTHAYGYEVAQEEIAYHLLGPSFEQAPDVVVRTPAAGGNALLMLAISGPSGADGETFSELHYSYALESGEKSMWSTTIAPKSNPIEPRNLCILRAGLAIRSALLLYEDANAEQAADVLQKPLQFCTEANETLNDSKLIEDIALMTTLVNNLCPDGCSE